MLTYMHDDMFVTTFLKSFPRFPNWAICLCKRFLDILFFVLNFLIPFAHSGDINLLKLMSQGFLSIFLNLDLRRSMLEFIMK